MSNKTIKTTKRNKQVKHRIKKSDQLITSLANVSKRPKQASVRLEKRLVNMLASCRTRDKKYDRETHITIGMLRELAKEKIGSLCPYCEVIIDHNNISFDHILPLSRGGESSISNVQFVCRTCNTQKDKMLDNEFLKLKQFILTLSPESQTYVNKKLSMQGGFNGYYKKTNTETTNDSI